MMDDALKSACEKFRCLHAFRWLKQVAKDYITSNSRLFLYGLRVPLLAFANKPTCHPTVILSHPIPPVDDCADVF